MNLLKRILEDTLMCGLTVNKASENHERSGFTVKQGFVERENLNQK